MFSVKNVTVSLIPILSIKPIHSTLGQQIVYKSSRAITKEPLRTENSLVSSGARISSSYIRLFNKAKELQSGTEREKFATVLKEFMQKEKFRRGHVAFIDGALNRIDEFNLEKDLLTYNRLFDLIPKNRYRSRTLFEALWPKPIPQIDLALRVLEKMEDNGVRPDDITYSLLCEIFGRTSFPVQKCVRMAILFDKYENIDPYRIKEFPSDQFEIAKIALQRMSSEEYCIEEILVPEGVDDAFVLAATSSEQREALKSLKDVSNMLLHVEGPHRLWVQKVPVFYYSLRVLDQSNPKDDGLFLGTCMCRPPSQDLLVEWIEYLQKNFPVLRDITIVYDVTVVRDIQDWSDQARKQLASERHVP